jgi:hypothetical protein
VRVVRRSWWSFPKTQSESRNIAAKPATAPPSSMVAPTPASGVTTSATLPPSRQQIQADNRLKLPITR